MSDTQTDPRLKEVFDNQKKHESLKEFLPNITNTLKVDVHGSISNITEENFEISHKHAGLKAEIVRLGPYERRYLSVDWGEIENPFHHISGDVFKTGVHGSVFISTRVILMLEREGRLECDQRHIQAQSLFEKKVFIPLPEPVAGSFSLHIRIDICVLPQKPDLVFSLEMSEQTTKAHIQKTRSADNSRSFSVYNQPFESVIFRGGDGEETDILPWFWVTYGDDYKTPVKKCTKNRDVSVVLSGPHSRKIVDSNVFSSHSKVYHLGLRAPKRLFRAIGKNTSDELSIIVFRKSFIDDDGDVCTTAHISSIHCDPFSFDDNTGELCFPIYKEMMLPKKDGIFEIAFYRIKKSIETLKGF